MHGVQGTCTTHGYKARAGQIRIGIDMGTSGDMKCRTEMAHSQYSDSFSLLFRIASTMWAAHLFRVY